MANGLLAKGSDMGEEYKFDQKALNMKGTGRTISIMDSGDLLCLPEITTKANFKTTCIMDSGS